MTDPEEMYRQAKVACNNLKGKYNTLERFEPRAMILLGTGTGKLADAVEPVLKIPYAEVPYMENRAGVEGHVNNIVFGTIEGTPVVTFAGRQHMYQGVSAAQSSFPVYLAHHFGAEFIMLTSACGITPDRERKDDKGNNPNVSPGDVMLVRSYFPNFVESALRGDPIHPGNRFVPTSNVPTAALVDLVKVLGEREGYAPQECVYIPRIGPAFETPAEVSFLGMLQRTYGCPVVGGMSVVPELEAAQSLGKYTIVFAIGTNNMYDTCHQDVARRAARQKLGALLDENGGVRYTIEELCRAYTESFTGISPRHEEHLKVAQETAAERVEVLARALLRVVNGQKKTV